VHEWLEEASRRLAAAVGEDPSAYRLSERDVEELLALARIAAHESGQRSTAPLASYLVGLAHGRHPGRALGDVTDGAAGV
jgi:hypothetical protein